MNLSMSIGREKLHWRERDMSYKQSFSMAGREFVSFLLTYPFRCVTSTRSRSLLAILQTTPREAGIELKKITTTLCGINECDFTAALDVWYAAWSFFLKEKTTDPVTGRWHFTHKRLRSAYGSLRLNLPTSLPISNTQISIFPIQQTPLMDVLPISRS